jgi:hypothetical protein
MTGLTASIPWAKSLLLKFQEGNCHGKRLASDQLRLSLSLIVRTSIFLLYLEHYHSRLSNKLAVAGHERYLRTTVFGLLSSSPNYCLLMVAANNGLIGMSKEHLGIALALNVPVMVVITKIDICPPQILEQTIQQITVSTLSLAIRDIILFIWHILP